MAPSQGKAPTTRWQAPSLAKHQISPKGKAKRLETKLEVAMAKIQSAGGDRDESTRG
jgi:hypothetical protein